MKISLQKATPSHIPQIWEILQQAIAQRKADGSSQWQNGYPNESVTAAGNAYVFRSNKKVIAYMAITFGVETLHTHIVGNWLMQGTI